MISGEHIQPDRNQPLPPEPAEIPASPNRAPVPAASEWSDAKRARLVGIILTGRQKHLGGRVVSRTLGARRDYA